MLQRPKIASWGDFFHTDADFEYLLQVMCSSRATRLMWVIYKQVNLAQVLMVPPLIEHLEN